MLDELEGRTAVITGAAGGIGSALARAVARAGMNVVVADIDADGLARVRAELDEIGAPALAVVTDVSDAEQVSALARAARDRFGDVHLLCNHAGVLLTGESWLAPPEDWQWVMGVNLGGVLNMLRAFVPDMLEHGQPGHILNASSIGALLTEPLAAPYVTALRAATTVSESLHHELRRIRASIGVSVLIPGAVATQLGDAERHRPPALARPADYRLSDAAHASMTSKCEGMAKGASPDAVAAVALDGIRNGTFWIFSPGVASFEPRLRAAWERTLTGAAPIEAFGGAR